MSRRAGKVVMFDVDGVLADFSTGYDAICEKLGVLPPGPNAPWDAKLNSAVWDHIRQSSVFWAQLRRLVSDQELDRIAMLTRKIPVYFVTARVGATAKQQTDLWLASWLLIQPTVIISHLKGEAAVVLGATHAIDDKAGNSVAISYLSDARSYVIDRPYNQFDHAVIGGKVTRVKTVQEFLDDVEAA